MGPCQITDMQLWPAADYEPCCGHVSLDKVHWRTKITSLHEAEDDAVKWPESTATTAFPKCNELEQYKYKAI